MLLLTVKDVVRQFDAAPVLDGVTFEVCAGEKIGLVGPNGAGKTTLLRILTGADEPDAGECVWHASAQAALLEQEAVFADGRTLLDEAKAGLAPLYDLQRQAEEAARSIADESDPALRDKLQRRYDALQHDLHRHAAYNIDHRVDEVLLGLGFTGDQYDRPLTQLSGGQQNRVLLARLLLAAPDLMLLDEPTNHLDIAATEWLEEYLAHCEQAILVVSHDRYFLDKVTNRTLELYAGTTADFPGNFSTYWQLKEEEAEARTRTWEKQQAFIEKTEDFIRRNHYGKTHVQAHDREKKLARLERVERPRVIASPVMGFGKAKRAGDWVIETVALTKGFDRPLFRDVSLQILRGERVAIFGPNGCGKTTLLRTLLGELAPDAGSVRLGANVEIAYYDQQLSSIDPAANVVEAVRPDNNQNMLPATVRDFVARFGLRGDIVFQTVGSLSGGEKSKVALARVAALNANVLILDEPTNHLDLWSRAALEKALREFQGTLVFVSHDRYFIDRVATHLFAFEADRWRLYAGNYSNYVDALRRAREEARGALEAGLSAADKGKGAAAAPNLNDPFRRRRRFPYRKVDDLEHEIAAAETRLAGLQDDLGNADLYRDGRRVKESRAAYDELQKQLARLYEHWEEAVELN